MKVGWNREVPGPALETGRRPGPRFWMHTPHGLPMHERLKAQWCCSTLQGAEPETDARGSTHGTTAVEHAGHTAHKIA